MASIIFLLGCVFLNDPSYFLYMKDGRVMEVKSMPHFEGKFCYFSLQDGQKSMIPSSMIDFDKTEKYNLELQKEKERKTEETSRPEGTPDPETDKEPVVIKLMGTEALEKYHKTTPSGSQEFVAEPNSPDDNVLGQPRVQTWESTDDLYLAKETLSRIRTGYNIDCVLFANSPSGIQNARLTATVTLENGDTVQLEGKSQPTNIPYNSHGLVHFFLETEYLIQSTSYSVNGEIP
jgi:hypothetical protein